MPFPNWAPAIHGVLHRLAQKRTAYWIRLVITILAVQFLVGWADKKGWITGYRYGFYRFLQKTKPHKATDQNTVVITIDDDEYWMGKPQGRAPIKRDYLACLVQKLDAAEAKVIALDFDLRSPAPDGKPVENRDYAKETETLLDTVKTVSSRRAVVLARTIWKKNDDYVLNSDIYDGYDFGQAPLIFKGYIALPYNRLKIPLTLKLKGDVPLDSFSMAVVRAFRPKALNSLPEAADAIYGTFIGSDDFDHRSAHEVLAGNAQDLKAATSGRVVIIGGAWSRWAYGVGAKADSHETPLGPMPGVYLHANYVEAMLDEGTYPPLRERAVQLIESIVVAFMAIAFAIGDKVWKKIVIVLGSWIVLGLVSYFSFINLGVVFDLFVPALSVTLHWAFEHIG